MSGPPGDGRRWETVEDCGPFADLVGPLFVTCDQLSIGEQARFGFKVAERHCNARPICHGGMLATFLDIALARGLRVAAGVDGPIPTISMTLDYLSPAALGEWVEARVTVIRAGPGTSFVQAMLHAGDRRVLRGSGVYKRIGGATSG